MLACLWRVLRAFRASITSSIRSTRVMTPHALRQAVRAWIGRDLAATLRGLRQQLTQRRRLWRLALGVLGLARYRERNLSHSSQVLARSRKISKACLYMD